MIPLRSVRAHDRSCNVPAGEVIAGGKQLAEWGTEQGVRPLIGGYATAPSIAATPLCARAEPRRG
jgi:hypothetical protein